MEKSFIVATDGSHASREAEEFAQKLLDREDDRVIVVSVAEFGNRPASYPGAEDPSSLRDQIIEKARSVSEEAASRFEHRGFRVESEHFVGDPGKEICRLAEQRDVDGIIMGRHARGAIQEVLLGSVSNYVVHHAPCPVTVVPPQPEEAE